MIYTKYVWFLGSWCNTRSLQTKHLLTQKYSSALLLCFHLKDLEKTAGFIHSLKHVKYVYLWGKKKTELAISSLDFNSVNKETSGTVVCKYRLQQCSPTLKWTAQVDAMLILSNNQIISCILKTWKKSKLIGSEPVTYSFFYYSCFQSQGKQRKTDTRSWRQLSITCEYQKSVFNTVGGHLDDWRQATNGQSEHGNHTTNDSSAKSWTTCAVQVKYKQY